eukprot:scaffold38511_cov37-Tisochrysis_lutea.AAC.2
MVDRVVGGEVGADSSAVDEVEEARLAGMNAPQDVALVTVDVCPMATSSSLSRSWPKGIGSRARVTAAPRSSKEPHVHNMPSRLAAHAWCSPAASTSTRTARNASTILGVRWRTRLPWPSEPCVHLPHEKTAPSQPSASVKPLPAETEWMRTESEGSEVGERHADGPPSTLSGRSLPRGSAGWIYAGVQAKRGARASSPRRVAGLSVTMPHPLAGAAPPQALQWTAAAGSHARVRAELAWAGQER